jgi:hypothetical protein
MAALLAGYGVLQYQSWFVFPTVFTFGCRDSEEVSEQATNYYIAAGLDHLCGHTYLG